MYSLFSQLPVFYILFQIFPHHMEWTIRNYSNVGFQLWLCSWDRAILPWTIISEEDHLFSRVTNSTNCSKGSCGSSVTAKVGRRGHTGLWINFYCNAVIDILVGNLLEVNLVECILILIFWTSCIFWRVREVPLWWGICSKSFSI